MIHILVISIFLAVYLRDGIDSPLFARAARDTPAVFAWSIGSMAFLWLLAHAAIWILGRRMDRAGSFRAAQRAESVLLASRLTAAALHAFNVLALGWLDAIRRSMGDLIGLDEFAACTPALALLVMGWWSFYPIDRRLREAVVLHELDDGRAMPPMPTRRQFVITALRHQVLWLLIPISVVLAWGEQTDRWARTGALTRLQAGALQFVGMVALLMVMPLIMRRLWDTISLGAGPLRDRLSAMCREQRVRVRDLLIWRTHGTMINGAVMGLLPRLRYILLTDALIEYLPPEQVEAVTAHELGHVRRRHLLWLAAAALGSITVVSWLIQIAYHFINPRLLNSEWAQGSAGAAALAIGLLVFGFVSRRFEWQADAFAVQHLSGFHRGSTKGIVLTADAVAAMRGALDAVARLNHISKKRFTWRHGSIATRQRKLSEIIGLSADRLPIDRHSRWLSIAAALTGLAAVGLVVWSGVSSEPQRRGAADGLGSEVLGAIRQDAGNRERLHLP